jgi:Ca-activated chloride channel family protein
MNFAQPGWLSLLLLIPLLAGIALFSSRLRKKQWTGFMAPRLRDALLIRAGGLPRWISLALLLAACTTCIIALARPRGDAGTRTEKTIGRNVMLALDISRSMRVADVKPDRLAQTKVLIYELLEAMPQERIGLIGFAGNAHIYAPLTIDHSAVRETVDQIDESWAPLGGSDLAAAVRLAIDTLKKTGQKNNALVILSDGEKHDGDLDTMIADAEQAGVFIIAIGVGTEDGGFVPHRDFPNGQLVDRTGRPVISRLHSEVLQRLANGTNGRFSIIGAGMDIPAMVQSVVKDLDAFEMDGREQKISIEFYQWLMLPAILLLFSSIFTATRWKGLRKAAAPLLLAAAFLYPTGADASEASRAKSALLGERNQEAQQAYQNLAAKTRSREQRARYRLGEATAAYRAEDFRSARTAFSRATLTRQPPIEAAAHLGLGNSLFQIGWKSLSGETYPSAPDALPDLDRFDTIVKEALAKLRQSTASDDGENGGFTRIETLITNWADAIRHYDSTLALEPKSPSATQNRNMVVTYLKRLQDLLDEEKQDTQDSMPQEQPGQGQPGEGQPQEGEGGENGEKPDGENGENEKDPKDGKGDQEKDDPAKNGKKGDSDQEKNDGDSGKGDPNESPEERAHRILKENADLEKGPLSPGRREFRDARKDW